MPLSMGVNVIQAVGRDRVGNFVATSIHVTRQAPSQARITLVSGNNQAAVIGTPVSAPLVVAVTDATGPVANKGVIFKVKQNDGLLSAAGNTPAATVIATTNGQGQAQVTWTLGHRAGAGSDTVEAYAVGYSGTARFTATGTQSASAMIVVDTGNDQVGAIGEPLPKPFIAVVTDAGHNRLGGVPVTFTMQQGGGSFGADPAVTTVTDSDGPAAATLTLGQQEGNANNVVVASFPSNPGFAAAFAASGRAPGNPAQTTVTGVVLDNANQPIQGVTVRAILTTLLHSSPGAVATAPSATTDGQGQFTIAQAPIGTTKLLVDGSTAQRPGVYPSLEYDLSTVAGQSNTVGLPIFLLPIDTSHQLCVTDTTGGGTLTLPEAPGFSLTFAPGQVTFPGGSKAGCVSVTPVHGDKVPMSPGFGQQPNFIVTIQPVGATFDPPAAITIPNIDGLAPRAVTELYSFDHDIGSFVAIGTGTVTDAGQAIRSSPGVGVMKAGWHSAGNPIPSGTAATCPTCKTCIGGGSECVPDATLEGTLVAPGQCCYGGSALPLRAQNIDTLLNACAGRADNDTSHYVDGCSIGLPNLPSTNIQNPVLLTAGILYANQGNSTAFGDYQGTVSKGNIDSLPCNQHDLCYQTCGSVKSSCDERLRSDEYLVCAGVYPTPSCPFTGLNSVFCGDYYYERALCYDMSDLIVNSLEGLGLYGLGVGPRAQTAWNQGQLDHCDCCK